MNDMTAFDPAELDEAADGEAMPDSELLSILQAHEAQAIGYEPGSSEEISSQQEKALNYYYRIMDDIPAQEGCSSVTDGTVQTVIDNALAAVLKPFVSSDETVRFSPRGPEDVDTADQATEYVNYVFNCDNPGFLIIHDWFKDALLSKLGVVKVWWEEQPRIDGERQDLIADLMAQQLARMASDYLGEEGETFFFGTPVNDGRVKVANVPPEEFRLSPFSRSVETATYAAHVPSNVTRSDLIEMGFDAEVVESLPADTSFAASNMLRTARYEDERVGDDRVDAPHVSQDRMAIRDEYVRVDCDGDGIAELRRVVRVEDTILLNEAVASSPFAALCPIPMPHKVYGLSLADLVIELQKINTVLWRQMLDNLYKSNNPRPVVGEPAILDDGATADSLNDNAPGAEILVKDINSFRFEAVPFTAGNSIPMLEMVSNAVEERTGVSKSGQGLDTNALRKSGQMTATEMAMISAGKNARIEMIARVFAETGVKRLFKIILELVTAHQPKERIIRLRNQWVPVDPRGWPEMDVEISVGLGIGEKSEQIAQADSVLATMAELARTPFAALIDTEKVYNAVKRKLTAAGIKNTDEYLNEPSQIQQQPPQPSPEEQKMQADMQMQQAKLQGDQQLSAAKLQMQQQEAALKLQLQREQAAAEQQLAREKAEFEAELAVTKMRQESELAQMKMAMESDLARERAALQASFQAPVYTNDEGFSTNRPGGDLSE